MKALDRKLFRDLGSLRGQVLTIALVVASGISSYVTMRSAYDSLVRSRDAYYEASRFSDVFVSLKRAPKSATKVLEDIAGVAEVETRLIEPVLVPLPELTRAASGSVVSLPSDGDERRLNELHLKEGRRLDANHPDEVLVLSAFAEARGLGPGDSLPAVLNGTLHQLRIVGVVMSPEYIMNLAPGQLTYEPGQSPVLWMNESALSAIFRMEGAFNSASFRLSREASLASVQGSIDESLRSFGSYGAVAREKQVSHYLLASELQQLDNLAGFVPYLFLGVAALLVNVVLSRLVQIQRGSIATLKALGYPDRTIGFHYLKLVATIVGLGALLGVGLGTMLGRAMMRFYTGQFFRFPDPQYHLEARTVLFAVAVSFGAAIVGAWVSVRSVMAMAPAEAMQPPAPARFRRSLFEKIGVWRFFSPTFRMIWRELSRRPFRLVLSAIGISLAVGIVVVARSMGDSIDYLIEVQFQRSMREDINVTFDHPLAPEALRSLEHLPGVYRAEGLRSVPVRFRAGHHQRDSVLNGYPKDLTLRRLLDTKAVAHSIPDDGILLTKTLADLLELRVGDVVNVEVREGSWGRYDVKVAGLVEESFGLSGHMSSAALSRLVGDRGTVSTALLATDPGERLAIERRLKDFPRIAGVSSPRDFRRQFDAQSAAMMNFFTALMTFFSCIIAVGVIYNNARVALSQRSRELASLRVLGFTRKEVATILFGEQAIQAALAVPLGLLLGRGMAILMMSNNDPETYRLPVLISSQTYLFAVFVTLISALFSAVLLQRKLNQLDLIGVLTTRD